MTKDIPAGTLVLVSQGEYSDYTVLAVARTLKPIDEKVWDEMKAACKSLRETDANSWGELSHALPWFLKNGYMEEVEHQEMHLGYIDLLNWEEV